jgi:hypothetical protein
MPVSADERTLMEGNSGSNKARGELVFEGNHATLTIDDRTVGSSSGLGLLVLWPCESAMLLTTALVQ